MIANADREVLRRYGAGEIDVAEAAELLRTSRDEAQAAYEARQARVPGSDPHPADEDAAATRGWSVVGVALATRVISRKQYEALVVALGI